MEQNLRQLFLQTLNPNDNIRAKAEKQLKSVGKSTELMSIIQNVLMKDSDKIVHLASCIYFSNTITKFWDLKELSSLRESIEQNILTLIMIEDKHQKTAYKKILLTFLENSGLNLIKDLFNKTGIYLKEGNIIQRKVVLDVYEELFRSKYLMQYTGDILNIIFNNHGYIFIECMIEAFQHNNFEMVELYLKIISKTYSGNFLPYYLMDLQVFKTYFNITVQITKLTESVDIVLKAKKWAYSILYNCTKKTLQKKFENSELVSFIGKKTTLEEIYLIFTNVIADHAARLPMDQSTLSIAADFFAFMAEDIEGRYFIKENYLFLIDNYILPVLSFYEEFKKKLNLIHMIIYVKDMNIK